MKRFFAVLLVLCLMIPVAFAEGAPLIYRVTDNDGHILYLFGTIHVGDDDTYDLVRMAYDTLISCDQVALELDPIALQGDIRTNFMMMASLYLKQGDSISNYLSEKTVEKGYELFDEPKAFMERLSPAAWFSFAQDLVYKAAELDSEYGVDWYVASMAYAEDIEVVELENYADQLSVFSDLSLDLLDFMIYTKFENIDTYKKDTLDLVKAWSEGDEAELSRLIALEDEIPDELQAEYDSYLDNIQTKRDDAFLEDAVRLLKSGKTAMIAIGAAHISGENGLVARLRALGYTVEIAEQYLSASVSDGKRES